MDNAHHPPPRALDPRPARAHRPGLPDGGPALPLEAALHPSPDGWTVRLPLRAETVTVRRQAFVAEEVVVRRRRAETDVHLRDTVRREELRLDTRGDLDPTDDLEAPGDLEATRRYRPARPGRPGPPR
jgi:hypothetical protein